MFRFAHLGRVWWPVELPYGSEDGGEPVTIHLLFKLFTDPELDAHERTAARETARQLIDSAEHIRTVDQLSAVFDATQAVKEEGRAEVLKRVLGWRGVATGDSGEADEPFTIEKVAAMLQHRPFLVAVRTALYQASRDGVAKNSKPGPGGSPVRAQA